jgi:hypothetical protein
VSVLGTPTLALGTFAWRVSRAVLLQRAGATALKQGSDDQRGKAGLEIVKALTSDDESCISRSCRGASPAATSHNCPVRARWPVSPCSLPQANRTASVRLPHPG